MRGLDLNIFDFDYDLQWFALMLSADGAVLGRFGGRDADTPAKYQTMPAFRHSLEEAVKRHRSGGAKTPPTARKIVRAEDYPAAAKLGEKSCIHCHHVYEFRRDLLQTQGHWTLDDVWVYPQPENIGLTLDADRGAYVTRVKPDSPMAKAGLHAKDVLLRVNAVPIASVADLQYALHRAPKQGDLAVVWQSGTQEKQARIPLAEHWRQTDVSWRWSLKSMSPSPGVIGDDLDIVERKKLGLDVRQLAYRQMNYLPPPARHAGLQTNDVITGIDNQPLFMNARQFETHIRLHYRVGQEIALNILRGKERVTVRLKLAE